MRVKELFAFIKERHSVYLKRAAGEPKPWTDDPILQSYRFCNVYRELDTVTDWIRRNWREPYDTDKHLWLAMTVARLVNWPDSLLAVEPGVFSKGRVEWNPGKFLQAMEARQRNGAKVFTGAYMVRCDCQSQEGGSKAKYLADSVLGPLWECRRGVPNADGGTLKELHNWLTTFHGLGSFMAGQVVADTKFQSRWRSAPDWWTFAAPGPGSLRGLSRVEFGELGTRYSDAEFNASMADLSKALAPLVAKAYMPRISGQDLNNVLCEFDKHERVRLGEGKPRARYPGGVI